MPEEGGLGRVNKRKVDQPCGWEGDGMAMTSGRAGGG